MIYKHLLIIKIQFILTSFDKKSKQNKRRDNKIHIDVPFKSILPQLNQKLYFQDKIKKN